MGPGSHPHDFTMPARIFAVFNAPAIKNPLFDEGVSV